jgi:hypothetical protein
LNISKSPIFSSNKLKNIKNSVIPKELLTNPTKTLNTLNITTTTPNLANLSEITSYDTNLCFRYLSSNLHAKTAKASAWTSLDKYIQNYENQDNSITPTNHNAVSLFYAKLVPLVIRSRATNKLETSFEASSVPLNTTDQDTDSHVLENPLILLITDFLDTTALELIAAITSAAKTSILVSKPGARPKP